MSSDELKTTLDTMGLENRYCLTAKMNNIFLDGTRLFGVPNSRYMTNELLIELIKLKIRATLA